MMKAIIAIYLLLVFVNCNITVITDGSSLRQICDSAPGWKINLCNLTCETCLSTDSSACQSCASEYVYKDHTCYLTSLYNNYFYYSYFTKVTIATSQLTSFTKGLEDAPLEYTDLVNICSNSYRFYMVGLFSNNDAVNYKHTFSQTMQQFNLKFNLLLLCADTQLILTIKTDSGVETKKLSYNTVSQAVGTYSPFNSSTSSNMLTLPALSSVNARSFIQVVTFSLSKKTKKIEITFQCLSPNADDNSAHWAISDVSLLIMHCNTCVTTKVQSTIDNVGLLVLYLLAVTVVMIAILFCFMKIDSCLKQRKILQRLSSGKDFLPEKGIDRVCNSINRMYLPTDKKDDQLRETRLSRMFKHISKKQ